MRGGKREGAGRPKGSRNKYNLRRELEERGVDINEVIIEVIDEAIKDKKGLELLKIILPYVYAKQENDRVKYVESKWDKEFEGAFYEQVIEDNLLKENGK